MHRFIDFAPAAVLLVLAGYSSPDASVASWSIVVAGEFLLGMLALWLPQPR